MKIGAWPEVPLAQVLTHYTESIAQPEAKIYPKLSVRLYGRGVVLDTPADGSLLKMKRHQIAKRGQVILSEIWGKKGAIGLVPDKGDGALCTSHFFLFDVREDKIDRKYLGLIFTANRLESQLDIGAKGSTGYAAVRPKHLLGATIPLPPIEEQRRIVGRIEAIAGKIEEARGLRRAAAAEADGLSRAAARQVLSRPGNNPQRLGDIVSLRGGGTPSKGNPLFWNGSIPWITPKDMKTRAVSDSLDHISETATQVSSARIIDPGCVLIVVRGMILAHTVPSAVLLTPAAINQDMKALVPSDSLLPEYLCCVLWASNAELRSLVERSTHDTRKLETPKLLDFRIPVPALREQQELVADLAIVEAKAAALKGMQKQTNAELEALLPSVLERAFRGEM